MALERQLAAQELGRKIARHRVRLNLTQEDAAARVGVTHRAYQRWESGEAMPYPRNIQRLAEAFEVEISDLYAPDIPALEDTVGVELRDQLNRIEESLLLLRAELTRAEVEREHVAANDADKNTDG